MTPKSAEPDPAHADCHRYRNSRAPKGHFAQEKPAILASPPRPYYPALRRNSTYTSIPVGSSPPCDQQRHSPLKWLPSGRKSTRAWRLVQDATIDPVSRNRENIKNTPNRNAEEFKDVKNILCELSINYYNFHKGGQPYGPQKIEEAVWAPHTTWLAPFGT